MWSSGRAGDGEHKIMRSGLSAQCSLGPVKGFLDHCKSPCCNVDLKSDILFIVGLDWLAATVRVGTWSI